MSSLYIHIPFCRSKCLYCSFVSTADGSDFIYTYAAALKKELSELATINPPPLDTIFIGGGTPTVLPGELLIGILDHCHKVLRVDGGAELSVEANPCTVSKRSLQFLSAAGVNRLSIGVQSFDDLELKRLGRIHSSKEAVEAIHAAREAGFDNLSFDLMCGLPGQSVSSWQRSLDQALSFSPEHLSVYQLTVEEETPLAMQVSRGTVKIPDEEDILEMDRRTISTCEASSLFRYEISNYSRVGYACRHNINYWQNGEYLACGAAAVSYLAGVREKRTQDIKEYCERIDAGQSVIVERESLPAEASFRETVIMGLRMVCGVDREQLRSRYDRDVDEYYGVILVNLVHQGLIELTDTHLRLTRRGLSLANRVMAELV